MSIIVALDANHFDKAMQITEQLDPKLCRVKVGKELFTQTGSQVIKALHNQGFEVFLDLKFHDIPNTTAQAVLAAADMGVWMTNVHASGGRKMMETCMERLAQHNHQMYLIAVTVLTSMAQQDLADIGIDATPEQHVLHLAKLTADCGLHGVVCSAQEAPSLRQAITQADFQLITPGIRPAGSSQDDQQRIVTPVQAMQDGANHLVIGRPITQSENPRQTLQDIYQSLQNI
ncbi:MULTISPECIES: orotidine-5'-phosphate decarboxylase [unclassified Acinetobacter]|uniref:orotidine-5'-phosphate decarboxylase n=1 Tax=unclassified Acinetobacter TaxID=196816 RepID=UPI0035B7305D